MIGWLQKAWRVGRQARENVDAVSLAEAAYDRGATAAEVLSAYGAVTAAAGDDRLDDGLLAGIGEARQAVYNAAEVLRGAAAAARDLADLADALAAQADEAWDVLRRLEREPLKAVLEGRK